MSQRIWFYIIVILGGIGLLVSVRQLLLPIIIFGAIFLLWKFPPDRWFRSQGRSHTKSQGPNPPNYRSSRSNASDRRQGSVTKTGKFRVIPGNKPNDDDDGPKYHYTFNVDWISCI